MKTELKINKFIIADFQYYSHIAKRALSHAAAGRGTVTTPMKSNMTMYVPRLGKIPCAHMPNNSTLGNPP